MTAITRTTMTEINPQIENQTNMQSDLQNEIDHNQLQLDLDTEMDATEEFTLALSDMHFLEEEPSIVVSPSLGNDADISADISEKVINGSEIAFSAAAISDRGFDLSLPAALCDEALIKEVQSIPDKMGFKIGEVADMLGIKQYVLRYWESEFDILKPKKAPNNQRYYTKKDVENAYLIRKLLHRDRFSIEGARSAMKDLKTFVRSEVKKEKDISTMNQKFEVIHDQLDDLILDIRELRQIFE